MHHHVSSLFLAGNSQQQQEEEGVCHTLWPCAFTLKSILRQKKNYGNSNISTCKNIISTKKSSKRFQNPSRYYYNSIITKISSFNTSQNIIFWKSSYQIRIYYYLWAKKSLKLLHSIMNLNTKTTTVGEQGQHQQLATACLATWRFGSAF